MPLPSDTDVSSPKHLRDKYAIVGVGETTYTRGSGKTTRALGTWAVRNAILDAGLTAADIDGIAAENLQARIRGMLWMAESNQHGPSIVLACGNKSELAVGYSTIYGDAVGGYAPIKDVPKTWVWKLASWRNSDAVSFTVFRADS